jgi:hypothetical protein
MEKAELIQENLFLPEPNYEKLYKEEKCLR